MGISTSFGVSNPWREAIEARQLIVPNEIRVFPILGGRLLKSSLSWRDRPVAEVSNPWREAIEETPIGSLKPFGKSFQSLEGGY